MSCKASISGIREDASSTRSSNRTRAKVCIAEILEAGIGGKKNFHRTKLLFKSYQSTSASMPSAARSAGTATVTPILKKSR